jgi:hypothetical protein
VFLCLVWQLSISYLLILRGIFESIKDPAEMARHDGLGKKLKQSTCIPNFSQLEAFMGAFSGEVRDKLI